MKVATILGTRPEIIRLSRVIAALDKYFDHVLIHTGQNYNYELNLVLKDGERINVVDHGNLKKIQDDANTLSNFLGKPVWDAT